MTTEQFEILDMHMHSWAADGMAPYFSAPHAPCTYGKLDETVFAVTLSLMNELGICQSVLGGPNNVTLEWCQRAPGRFIPYWWPCLDPLDPEDEAAQFSEAVETQGFRGLGELIMHYAGIAVNDERFFPLYRVCAERHLPVIMHTGFNGPDWPRSTRLSCESGQPLASRGRARHLSRSDNRDVSHELSLH